MLPLLTVVNYFKNKSGNAKKESKAEFDKMILAYAKVCQIISNKCKNDPFFTEERMVFNLKKTSVGLKQSITAHQLALACCRVPWSGIKETDKKKIAEYTAKVNSILKGKKLVPITFAKEKSSFISAGYTDGKLVVDTAKAIETLVKLNFQLGQILNKLNPDDEVPTGILDTCGLFALQHNKNFVQVFEGLQSGVKNIVLHVNQLAKK